MTASIDIWRASLLAALFAACAPHAPAQRTVRFNPVDDRVTLETTIADGTATVRWPGGGQLQRWDGRAWSLLARETPHRESAAGTALFRVVDPWNRTRTAAVQVPASYRASTPMPLIVLLHGYTNTGPQVEDWFKFQPLASSRGFLLAYPTGTLDNIGQPFWNAIPACCRGTTAVVDDSQFLRALIEGARRRLNVDPRRIYLVGHSNGGFMAYRMACDHADLVAGVVSLAGATNPDTRTCAPSQPVHVLQVHGTSDGVIWYNGGVTPWGAYPGALRTIETWRSYNGSDTPFTARPAPTLDLDSSLSGLDTTVLKNTDGSAVVEHWRIEGGAHSPNLRSDSSGQSTAFAGHVIDWLFAHPKP